MDGIGAGGSGGHTIHEVANLKAITMEAKRTAILLYRLTRQSRQILIKSGEYHFNASLLKGKVQARADWEVYEYVHDSPFRTLSRV